MAQNKRPSSDSRYWLWWATSLYYSRFEYGCFHQAIKSLKKNHSEREKKCNGKKNFTTYEIKQNVLEAESASGFESPKHTKQKKSQAK